MFRGRRQSPGIAIWLLAMQMYRMGLNTIPPVTLWTVFVQAAIYLRLLGHQILPSISNVCISTVNVWYRKEWQRLFLGALWHLDDWHLYYNMVSFLWKGRTLERKLGSGHFLLLLFIFTGLVSAVTVGLGFVLAELTDDMSYLSQCAAGFSGVIFALKMLTTDLLPANVMVMGMIPVPSRWACWVELLIIQMIVPNASFIGHLAGILVGLAYTKGPLKTVIDKLFTLVSNFAPTNRPTRFNSQGMTGQGQSEYNHYARPVPPTSYARNYREYDAYHSAPSYPSSSQYQDYGGASSAAERDRVRQHWSDRYSSSHSAAAGSRTGTQAYARPAFDEALFTGGMSEEEQMRRAMGASVQEQESNDVNDAIEASLRSRGRNPQQRLYPNLS